MARRRNCPSATALVIAMAVLLLLLAPGFAGRGGIASAQQNTRLAGLQIEIWPEYDRPAALVILRAQLPEDVALPAAMSLRIPASSEEPLAVASAGSALGELLNMPFDRVDAGDAITLTFTAERRFLHVEFYDPIQTDTADRTYTYTWPGDLSAETVSVRVQQPASSSDLSTQPALASPTAIDGLTYLNGELGALEAGKTLPVTVSYRKTDSRTSAEILGLTAPGTQPAATSDSGDGVSPWFLLPAVAAGLLAGAVLATAWQRRPAGAPVLSRAERRRRGKGGDREKAGGFCPQCGAPLDAGNRFCSRCGAAARSR